MENKPKIALKPKTSPLLAGLSDYLKDPANFEEINKRILNTFISTCGHTEIMQWAECKVCTAKMLDRRKILRELGFKNPRQYMAWRKIHEEIKARYPLVDWKYNKQSIIMP